jgi:DNA-binding MarR family transcriptional regulator
MGTRGTSLSLLFELFVANQEVRTLLAAAMAGSPLTAEEYAVYSAIDELGPMSPTALARAVGMAPTTVSHYLRSMHERRHIDRGRNAADGRSYVLTLSASGKAAHGEANRAFEEAYGEFIAGITDVDRVSAAVRQIQRAAASAHRALATDATEKAG